MQCKYSVGRNQLLEYIFFLGQIDAKQIFKFKADSEKLALPFHRVSSRFQLKNRFPLQGEQTLVPRYNYKARVNEVNFLFTTELDVARVCIRLTDIVCSPKTIS